MNARPNGILQARKIDEPRAPLWIWAPMQFRDYTVHFSLSEFASGEREIDHVRKIASFEHGGEVEHLSGSEHNLILDPQTRELQAGSNVSFRDSDGAKRTVTMIPRCAAPICAPAPAMAAQTHGGTANIWASTGKTASALT